MILMLISLLLGAENLKFASRTVVHDGSTSPVPVNTVVLFPEYFYRRLKSAELLHLHLIDALAFIAPSGTSPLDVST